MPSFAQSVQKVDPVSYDLMVFDPAAAPAAPEAFLAWYKQKTGGRTFPITTIPTIARLSCAPGSTISARATRL